MCPKKNGKQHQRKHTAHPIGNRCGPDHAVYGRYGTQQEHQGDIQHAFTEHRQEKGAHALPCGLEKGNTCISAGGKGRSQTEDPQKVGAIANGIRAMTDKQSNKRPAPQQAYDGTQSSQPYGDAHGQGHGLFHPLMIPGSIGVSDEGQYPLRHAPHHAVGQHIHLFSHAQPRLEGDAVYSHERIQYRKGNIFKERHQAGRETGRQHSHRHSLRKHGLSGNERQAGAFPFTNKHPYKIQQRKYVGKKQAITQELVPIYEPLFADGSFGYRPGRSAKDAIQKVKEYAEQGYTYAVSLDLSKYFDTLNHEILLNLLRKNVKDERVVQLIKRYLKSGVMENGVVMETEEGSPQGGNLSPLLANIYLNEFDQEFLKRGVPCVRYADDIVLLAKSKRASERLLESSTKYLEEKLKLTVNREKLNEILTGYLHYYGITDNSERITAFRYNVMKSLFYWLNRRSQKKSYNWVEFLNMIDNSYPLVRARIYVSIYD